MAAGRGQPLLSAGAARSASPAGPSRLLARSSRFPIALLFIAMVIALVGMLLTFVGLESAGAVRERRVQPVDRDALRAGCGANLRAALGCPRPSHCRRVGSRERRGIRLLESREAPVRPRPRRPRHRGAVVRDDAPRELLRRALEPDSRRRAAGVAAGGRARTALRRARLREPGAAGIPRSCWSTVHDMDTRRDLVFALLAPTHRARFFTRPSGDSAARTAEAFDLAGVRPRPRRRRAGRGVVDARWRPSRTSLRLRPRAPGAARRIASATGRVA